jgi:hypothetical protein
MASLSKRICSLRTRRHALATFVFVLSLALAAGTLAAQEPAGGTPEVQGPENGAMPTEGPSDEELSAQLEAVILEEMVLPNTVNTVVQIPAMQDTYIASNKPNQNYGSAPDMRLGYSLGGSNDGALRPFVQFDLNRYVPSRAVINSATLQTYLFAASPANDTKMGAIARHLLTAWDQNLVTWNNHQPHWGSVAGSGEVSSQLGWQYTDVTGLAKEWHSGAHANYGLIFIGDEQKLERQRFYHTLNANNGLYPRLVVDYTLSTDTTPPVASIKPLPTWSPQRFFVNWDGHDEGGSGIAYFDVQYNTNGGQWIDWRLHTSDRSSEWVGGASGTTYQFRARAVDHAGNVQAWGPSQAQTTVDSTPPAISVDPLPTWTHTSAFQVSWSGSDNLGGSGLRAIDVQFQKDKGPWQDWLVNTTMTSALFTGAQDDGLYGFRARGIDNTGNVQPWSATAQATTRVETSGPHSHIIPFDPAITRDDSFLVSWTSSVAPGLTIASFDVRFSFADGPWVAWLTGTKLSSAEFTGLEPEDGIYRFEVRARDSAGREEPFSSKSEASIIVDRLEPRVVPQGYLPAAFRGERQ